MAEVFVRCLICGEQQLCTESPIPSLWRCPDCVKRDGPWPAPEPAHAGFCAAEGGHPAYRIYGPTKWGWLCDEHLRATARRAVWPRGWR